MCVCVCVGAANGAGVRRLRRLLGVVRRARLAAFGRAPVSVRRGGHRERVLPLVPGVAAREAAAASGGRDAGDGARRQGGALPSLQGQQPPRHALCLP